MPVNKDVMSHLLGLPGLVPGPGAVCVPVYHSCSLAAILPVPSSRHCPSHWHFHLQSKQLLSPPLLAGSRQLSSHCSEAGVWLPPKGGPKKCTAANSGPRPNTVWRGNHSFFPYRLKKTKTLSGDPGLLPETADRVHRNLVSTKH